MKKIIASIALSALFAANVFALTAADTAIDSSTQILTTQPQSLNVPTTQQASGFFDVAQTHPNYVAITYLKNQGILGGYDDGTFKPEQQVNRAEALKILLVGNKIDVPSTVTQVSFSDYQASDWFAKYVEKAKTMGIVNGNPDGTFAPARTVSRAEFLKMLLILNALKTEKWVGQQLFADVPKDAWYTPYMNYAGQAGLITKDDKNMVYPAQPLTRADVAEILYLMIIIRNDKDTQLLIQQTEAQMGQIEVYISANNITSAKRASQLGVDFSQQAYLNMPTNNVVLSAAKLAKAYDYLVNAFVSALQKDYASAITWSQAAIAKATEAWQVNNSIQPIARHIKDLANDILNQIAQINGSSMTQATSTPPTP